MEQNSRWLPGVPSKSIHVVPLVPIEVPIVVQKIADDPMLTRKVTLDTGTRCVSKGRSGSSSVNYQLTGRELMTPDEVRALDNDHCILFIRGELPVMDRKYDILKHPGLKLTEDGGAAPYIHRPGLTYALEDFPLSMDSWESIEIIE